ncbi:hypothetical protein B566_EDAN013213 [Ephemera danica]|nr:hypothetical protein B566_EDAN013213 [Ephemera danica]
MQGDTQFFTQKHKPVMRRGATLLSSSSQLIFFSALRGLHQPSQSDKPASITILWILVHFLCKIYQDPLLKYTITIFYHAFFFFNFSIVFIALLASYNFYNLIFILILWHTFIPMEFSQFCIYLKGPIYNNNY